MSDGETTCEASRGLPVADQRKFRILHRLLRKGTTPLGTLTSTEGRNNARAVGEAVRSLESWGEVAILESRGVEGTRFDVFLTPFGICHVLWALRHGGCRCGFPNPLPPQGPAKWAPTESPMDDIEVQARVTRTVKPPLARLLVAPATVAIPGRGEEVCPESTVA